MNTKIGENMEPEIVMDELFKELSKAIKAMGKAKTPQEKLQHSEIVKNISESLGVFLNLVSDMAPYDFEDDEIM